MHTPTMKEASQKGFLYYSRSKLGVQQNACGMNTWEKVPKKKNLGGGWIKKKKKKKTIVEIGTKVEFFLVGSCCPATYLNYLNYER